jgi:hypothetical protein
LKDKEVNTIQIKENKKLIIMVLDLGSLLMGFKKD